MTKQEYTFEPVNGEDSTILTFPEDENSAVLHLSESDLNVLFGTLLFAQNVCRTDEYKNMAPWHGEERTKEVTDKIGLGLFTCRSKDEDGSCYFLDDWLAQMILHYRYLIGEEPTPEGSDNDTVERFSYEIKQTPSTGTYYTIFDHPITGDSITITGETEQDVIKKADWLSDITPPEGVSNF